jgi:hypothetical protein
MYNILTNIFFQEHLDNKNEVMIRYFQIGVQNENGFTGIVGDFVGGGMFDDGFVFLDGELVDCDEQQRSYDYDEKEGFVEEKYPNLYSSIWKKLNELMIYDQNLEWYLPTNQLLQELKENIKNFDIKDFISKGKVLSNSDSFSPVEVGNTYFS